MTRRQRILLQRLGNWLGFEHELHIVIAAAALVLGALVRVAWNCMRPNLGTVGEVVNTATALALGHGLSDAYQVGQGPTAHLMPTMPLFVGSIYSVFGVKSVLAETLLAAFSISLTMVRFVLFNHVARRLGADAVTRLATLSFLCLVPVFISQEAVDFRVWEGGLASFMLAIFLLLLLDEGRRATPSLRLPIAAAVMYFVNPVIGVAGYATLGLYWLRNLKPMQILSAGAIAAVPLIVLLAPWMARNAVVMGAPVLRSNAGLELALAMNPAMLTSSDRTITYAERLVIHPATPSAYDKMQESGGEVAYFSQLGNETKAWMLQNPALALDLVAMHLRQAIAPETWMFQLFSNPVLAPQRAFLVSLVNILGMIALFWHSIRGERNWQYCGLVVLTFIGLLAFFQPIPRYICIVYPLLAYCAATVLSDVREAHSRGRWPRSTSA